MTRDEGMKVALLSVSDYLTFERTEDKTTGQGYGASFAENLMGRL